MIILETAKENSKKISGNSSTEAKDLEDFLPISFKDYRTFLSAVDSCLPVVGSL